MGCLFLIAAVRRFRLRRTTGGALIAGTTALVLFLLAGCALLIAANLRSYQRLSYEQPAGELQFSRVGDARIQRDIDLSRGRAAPMFALRGDEWQIDARVLKWQAFANLVGFDTAYRLERSAADTRHRGRTQPAAHRV